MSDKEDDEEKPDENLRNRARMDQGMAMIVSFLPSLWRNLYEGLQKQGFKEEESFVLLQTYILSQGTNGIHGVRR